MQFLTHLDNGAFTPEAVQLLNEPHRMYPTIGDFISNYQYSGKLKSSPGAVNRTSFSIPPILKGRPWAICYVLYEEGIPLHQIKHSRPDAGKRWIHNGTLKILEMLLPDE